MGLKEKLEGIRHRAQASPARRLALRLFIGTLGSLVIIIGIILIPFPGPGWAIVFAGLAILAIEFTWAQHVLRFARTQVEKWWHWLEHQHLIVRLLVGLITFAFVAAVVLLTLHFSLGIDVDDVQRFFRD